MVLAVLVGLVLSVHPAHSLFVAACLSLSSGPLAQQLIGELNVLYLNVFNANVRVLV